MAKHELFMLNKLEYENARFKCVLLTIKLNLYSCFFFVVIHVIFYLNLNTNFLLLLICILLLFALIQPTLVGVSCMHDSWFVFHYFDSSPSLKTTFIIFLIVIRYLTINKQIKYSLGNCQTPFKQDFIIVFP